MLTSAGVLHSAPTPAPRAEAAPAAAPKAKPSPAQELGRSALRALALLAGHDSSEVRALVAEAWGEIGHPGALPLLNKALADKKVSVRIEAAYALHRLGHSEGVPVLRAIVLKSTPPADGVPSAAEEMRALARNKARIRAIAKLGEIGGEEVVQLFETTLEDPYPAVRDATAAALARMGLEEFGERFIEAAGDADEGVRAAAVEVLGQIGRPEYFEAVRRAATDESVLVRVAAMRALDRFRESGTETLLVAGLQDPDPRVRARALSVLVRFKDAGSVPLLKEILRLNNNVEIQLRATAGLAARGEAVEITLADNAMRLKDYDIKRLALDALEAVDSPGSNEALRRALDEESDPRIRALTASILVRRLVPRP